MPETLMIRDATANDIKGIIELEQKCFIDTLAYSAKQLTYLITKAHSSCLVETCDEIIRGFIIVLFRRGTNVAGIETINVDPNYQNKGIGKKLIKAAEDEILKRDIKQIRLEVSVGNTPAVQLYMKAGFNITSLLKEYYTLEHYGSRDAYRMKKTIK